MAPLEPHPKCPICEADTNTYGQPFVSEWAVACHVAGKALSGERKHESWIREVTSAEIDGHVPSLAEEILPAVRHAISEARKRHPFTPNNPLDFAHDLEIKLHRFVRQRLEEEFGRGERGWWVNGVPLKIRQECQTRREEDPAREEPFVYTYLIDLAEIMDRQWPLFEPIAKQVVFENGALSKKELLASIRRINEIRNRYAHPVRAPGPGSQDFEEDLRVAKNYWQIVDQLSRLHRRG